MTARIFSKLIVAVLLVIVVALTAVDFLASRTAEDSYISGLRGEMEGKIRMLRVLAARGTLDTQPQGFRALADAAGGRLTLINADGVVTADSQAEPAGLENHGSRPEVRAALSGGVGWNVRDSRTLGVKFLYVAAPFPHGAMRLAVPIVEIHSQVSEIRRKLLLYVGLAFLPAVLVAAFFARYFSQKLGAIIDYAGTLATGNFRARLSNPGNDELGTLGQKLNETGAKLEAMFAELDREHVELERVERIRKDFVINVSHELRTPLASIQGYTETLLNGALDDKENNVRFLNIIRRNAERLGRLTADLLTLSRIELKTQKFQFASYYVNALLADCVDSMRTLAEKKNIQLELWPAPHGTEAFCDSEAVHQIMSNLLDNAIKYSPEGGRITVSSTIIRPDPDRPEVVEVGVADCGIGIPADELPRLFERFYRVDKARSRELGGTGLGLAIVKHLTRAQGGDVRVTSLPGKGSTFSFTLCIEDPGLSESESVQQQLTV
jgi:two-component system, OmpR family, phosphate regulon sensor histidine kinase PhoR